MHCEALRTQVAIKSAHLIDPDNQSGLHEIVWFVDVEGVPRHGLEKRFNPRPIEAWCNGGSDRVQ